MTSLSTKRQLGSTSQQLAKAALIYEYAHISASSLLVAFDDAKIKRGNPRGILPDQEQDILRAALVLSCAGLDASLKQSIRDCFETLLASSAKVREGFEKFIRKRISSDEDRAESSVGARFLARVLAEKDPRKKLIEEYITELTGDSLQSSEEILKAIAALGLDQKALNLDLARLKEVFGIRNKIIHELDIDLIGKKRKRRTRSQSDLLDSCDLILSTAVKLLEAVDRELKDNKRM